MPDHSKNWKHRGTYYYTGGQVRVASNQPIEIRDFSLVRVIQRVTFAHTFTARVTVISCNDKTCPFFCTKIAGILFRSHFERH